MTETLYLMPREMRLMSERIFSLTRLPSGFAVTLSDLPMLSEGLGLGGFAHLEEALSGLRDADPTRLAILSENGATLVLDAAGEHAWIALGSVLDLAGELVARFGKAEIRILNLRAPEELAVAGALAPRLGLAVDVKGDVLTASSASISDPVMDRLLADGLPLAADLWWRIYECARSALAPDTVVSRRHAGVVIVTEDGTIIGRKDNDDESDTGFLIRSGREAQGASA